VASFLRHDWPSRGLSRQTPDLCRIRAASSADGTPIFAEGWQLMNPSRPPMRRLFGISLSLLAALAMGGCATNPVTKKTELTLVSEQQEIKLGSQQYLQNQQSAGGKFILDPSLRPTSTRSGRSW
jgi:hypothetical protein